MMCGGNIFTTSYVLLLENWISPPVPKHLAAAPANTRGGRRQQSCRRTGESDMIRNLEDLILHYLGEVFEVRSRIRHYEEDMADDVLIDWHSLEKMDDLPAH
jgi:hypothetical protein